MSLNPAAAYHQSYRGIFLSVLRLKGSFQEMCRNEHLDRPTFQQLITKIEQVKQRIRQNLEGEALNSAQNFLQNESMRQFSITDPQHAHLAQRRKELLNRFATTPIDTAGVKKSLHALEVEVQRKLAETRISHAHSKN